MASIVQVLANRSNARKSTGPRTPAGKAAVAQNAVKHGLLAQRAVIQGEDPGEFELYRDRMLGDLDPVGSVEAMLAERIVGLAWRLRRAERFQSAAFATLEADHAIDPPAKLLPAVPPDEVGGPQGEPGADEELALGRLVVKDFGAARVLDQLLVYERRIENSLHRTMAELRRQRLRREAEAAEDVSSSEFRLQAVCESGTPAEPALRRVNAELQTAPRSPEDVTTNGTQANGPFCETNPIGAGTGEDRVPGGGQVEEVGRGRPTLDQVEGRLYEETSCGVATNAPAAGTSAPVEMLHHSNIPSFENSRGEPSSPVTELSCETKPKEVAGVKSQVSSEQSPVPGRPSLPTSNFTVETANGPSCGGTCETKPIDAGGAEDQVPFGETCETKPM